MYSPLTNLRCRCSFPIFLQVFDTTLTNTLLIDRAGRLKGQGDPAEGSVPSSEPWKYIVALADCKNDSWDAIKALADYNIKCGKITTAFHTHASRSLSTSQKLSAASAVRHELLKEETAALALACNEMGTEVSQPGPELSLCSCHISNIPIQAEGLEAYYETMVKNNFINKGLVGTAAMNPAYNNIDEPCFEFDLQRHARQIYSETTAPHDHILTKLQALSLELNYDSVKNDQLVSEARGYASE